MLTTEKHFYGCIYDMFVESQTFNRQNSSIGGLHSISFYDQQQSQCLFIFRFLFLSMTIQCDKINNFFHRNLRELERTSTLWERSETMNITKCASKVPLQIFVVSHVYFLLPVSMPTTRKRNFGLSLFSHKWKKKALWKL